MPSRRIRVYSRSSYGKKPKISTLPIEAKKKEILDAIEKNQVVILTGSTGTGKTTRVPFFLYEAGYAKDGKIIGITEPRRIAATTMAEWVGKEIHSPKEVSYHIRFDNNLTPHTKILFMTDGVLFKYFLQDENLGNFSAIIVDEVHERSVATDVTLGLLSNLLLKEKGLPPKIIIMSATMKLEDFTQDHLFKKIPPVIKLDSRQHPVNVYYSETSIKDHVKATFNKICKIHQTLPDGGILAFVTGQREIYDICERLYNYFDFEIPEDEEEKNKLVKHERPEVTPDSYSKIMSSEDEIINSLTYCDRPLHILPLYSKLPWREQNRIFKQPPKDKRLCVIATDVAETSITIPNIKYVIDSGLVKKCDYDGFIKTYTKAPISKASADQRTGRAGRESEGYCFRLYTEEDFEKLQDHTDPEIIQDPLDNVILQLKCLGFNDIIKFPFPTKPPILKVEAAEKRLVSLGAIETLPEDDSATVTEIGRHLIHYPVSPQFARILQLGVSNQSLPYIVALISAISVEELFLSYRLARSSNLRFQWKDTRKKWENHASILGDLALYLVATINSQLTNNSEDFCFLNGLRKEAMIEVALIRKQLTSIMIKLFPALQIPKFNPKLPVPSKNDCKSVKHLLLSGMATLNHLARYDSTTNKQTIYKCMDVDKTASVHESSVLSKTCGSMYLVYQYLLESPNGLKLMNVFTVDDKEVKVMMESKIEYTTIETPSYSKEMDQIVQRIRPNLAGFTLAFDHEPLTESEDKFRWFGYYLLKGTVFKPLKIFINYLDSSLIQLQPSSKESLKNVVLQKFYVKLITSKISTKNELKEIWKTDPNYLFEEYLNLLKGKKLFKKVSKHWPPLN